MGITFISMLHMTQKQNSIYFVTNDFFLDISFLSFFLFTTLLKFIFFKENLKHLKEKLEIHMHIFCV